MHFMITASSDFATAFDVGDWEKRAIGSDHAEFAACGVADNEHSYAASGIP
jgi:hypothetical protein